MLHTRTVICCQYTVFALCVDMPDSVIPHNFIDAVEHIGYLFTVWSIEYNQIILVLIEQISIGAGPKATHDIICNGNITVLVIFIHDLIAIKILYCHFGICTEGVECPLAGTNHLI